jgi:hypothetical protein
MLCLRAAAEARLASLTVEDVFRLADSTETASIAVMNIRRCPDLTHLTVAVAELGQATNT